MADREKLVELVRDAIKWRPSIARVVGETDTKKIADHLIANGVTVQEWIPVTERLPERYKYILLWDAMDRDIFMGVLDDKREWYIPGYDGEQFRITHWMPLPEPPKGE